jgi:Fe-S cluster biogenesis protein NfuA|tara:strand:- start:45 stop:446 length:402 start_codon:yes stop_codon:yes gene_type:complete
MKDITKETIKILEENKLTNIHTPEDQIKSHKVGEVVPQDDIEKNIKWVLEEKVGPTVAQHNGKIEFVSYKKGVLKLLMAGACSGCAMSKMTLHQLLENMLKHYVPEVHTIESEDDETAEEQGYNPWSKGDFVE